MAFLACAVLGSTGQVQATEQYFAGDGSAFNTSKYGTSPSGPFTTAFTSGNVIGFGVANGTGTGASITIGGLDAQQSFTLTPTGTLSTGGKVVTVSVSDGMTLNLGSQAISTTAGTGFIKTGTGTLALAASAYTGGFTLSAGTVVAAGVNAMGGGTTSTLAINGGTIAGSATRDFSAKYGGGITVGGDFQLGALTANAPLSVSAANLTFSDLTSLGAATRAITVGGTGVYTLAGTISGGSDAGLTTNALTNATGILRLTGTNTYTGATTLTGGTLEESVLANGSASSSLGASSNAASSLVLNGGTLSYIGTTAASTDRGITLGANGGGLVASGTIPTNLSGSANAANGNLAISGNIVASASSGTQALSLSGNNGTNNGAGVLSGVISDGSGTNATALVKSGTGTWTLTGQNTFSGGTTITGGTLKLADTAGAALTAGSPVVINSGGTLLMGANNQFNAAAPAPVTLSGASGSGNTSTFRLGGFNQGSTSANGVGALTLASGSVNNFLNFGNVAGVITFASFVPNAAVLTISAYSGNGAPGGLDELIFNEDEAGKLSNFDFGSGAGVNVAESSLANGFFEVYSTTPVPEPTTVCGGALLIIVGGWSQRRRFRPNSPAVV